MHIHILGICGTFMGGIAELAVAAGHRVTGSDSGVYPPMSEQLAALGVAVREGYEPAHLEPAPDQVIIGNVMSRGNPAVEYVLDEGLPYTSGPQWLAEHVLKDLWVLAVSGTHGKTSTSGMLAWILQHAGLEPGYLIGGVPASFGRSARATTSGFFVVEADEYDTAFFDKRSKFVHYRPRTLIINNVEFDHADIFADLEAIRTQFHHLVRTVPGSGLLVYNGADRNVRAVLDKGCWTPLESFSVERDHCDWSAADIDRGGRAFTVCQEGRPAGRVDWRHGGLHNVSNALAAIAAARHAGVPTASAIEALALYEGVSRRMELVAEHGGVGVYDDFAHHPTAIASTLAGLRADATGRRIFVILEPRSNSMKMGAHSEALAGALAAADRVLVFAPPGLGWDLGASLEALGERVTIHRDTDAIIERAVHELGSGDRVVVMSNGGFEGMPRRLAAALAKRARGVA